MSLKEVAQKYEEKMLSLPIAGQVSGEDDLHTSTDPEFKRFIADFDICGCDRCQIIRIKRRKAFRFSRTKCPRCGKLFISIFTHCDSCRKGQ